MALFIRDPACHVGCHSESDDVTKARLKDIARSAALGEDRKSHKSQNNINHDRQRPVHRTQQQPRQHRK